MKNVSNFDNFPPFAESGSRTMDTEGAKYATGFVAADTLPAEWANYLFHGASKGVTDLNAAVSSIWSENVNVLAEAGITPDATSSTQLVSAIRSLINSAILSAHPVGSYYWSSEPTDPSTLFGGTWEQIKDKFVLAKGDSDNVGATGGAKTITLTEANLPSHTHEFTPKGTVGSHSHTLGDHTHSFSGNTSDAGNHAHTGSSNYGNNADPDGSADTCSYPNTIRRFRSWADNPLLTNDSGNHNHSFSGTTSKSNGNTGEKQPSFTGTPDTTGAAGSGTPVDIMPPYLTAYCWRRTA